MPTPINTFPGRPFLSYPGISLFYKILYAGTILIRLPVWIVGFSLFKSARPLPTLTFKQSLLLRVFSKLVNMVSRTETPVPLSLSPGAEKDRWVLLEPFADPSVYRGPLAPSPSTTSASTTTNNNSIKPATIGGTWYPSKPPDPQTAGPIVYHIHGGGFVVGDGRSAVSGPMFALLLSSHAHSGQKSFKTIFAPQYRLSSRPTSAAFPAALQDVLTGYLYLVRTLGVRPADVVVAGDSAGANLAIALLRYLEEFGAGLGIGDGDGVPRPAAAVLVAPWVAPAKFLLPRLAVTSNPHFGSDYLGAELCRWGARTYIFGDGGGARAAAPDHPYIMALGHPFHTPVPMLVTFGGAEILAVDGLEWVREMEGVEGNVVEVFIEPDAPHDTVLVGHSIGFEESSAQVAKRIGEFVGKHVQSSN